MKENKGLPVIELVFAVIGMIVCILLVQQIFGVGGIVSSAIRGAIAGAVGGVLGVLIGRGVAKALGIGAKKE